MPILVVVIVVMVMLTVVVVVMIWLVSHSMHKTFNIVICGVPARSNGLFTTPVLSKRSTYCVTDIVFIIAVASIRWYTD